jgi:SAM-dependent methyltransferase
MRFGQDLLKRLLFRFMYFRKPPWDTGISPPELLEYLQSHPSGRALDLGCGTGTNVITLAQYGWSATGVDFVPRAISKARRKARAAGVQVTFHVDDAARLKRVQGSFDFALDMGCYHNLSNAGRRSYRENLLARLKPGGDYLLYGFLDTGEDPEGQGIGPEDLSAFQASFELISRKDGTERGWRPSAWFHFQKASSPAQT